MIPRFLISMITSWHKTSVNSLGGFCGNKENEYANGAGMCRKFHGRINCHCMVFCLFVQMEVFSYVYWTSRRRVWAQRGLLRYFQFSYNIIWCVQPLELFSRIFFFKKYLSDFLTLRHLRQRQRRQRQEERRWGPRAAERGGGGAAHGWSDFPKELFGKNKIGLFFWPTSGKASVAAWCLLGVLFSGRRSLRKWRVRRGIPRPFMLPTCMKVVASHIKKYLKNSKNNLFPIFHIFMEPYVYKRRSFCY